MAHNDRYQLFELWGYAEKGGRGSISYSILDRYQNWVEVYWRYAGQGGADAARRRDCVARMEAMNKRERAWRRQQ